MRHARSSVLTKPSVGSRFFRSAKEPGEACHGSATPATVRLLGDASSFPPAVSFVRPPFGSALLFWRQQELIRQLLGPRLPELLRVRLLHTRLKSFAIPTSAASTFTTSSSVANPS